jgi:hypothetical protein
MIPGPPGWQPVDYGNARVWVPQGWHVFYPGMGECGQSLVNQAFIAPQAEKCAERAPTSASVMTIGPLPNGGGGHTSTRHINGYVVLVHSSDTFWVPALSVQLTLDGPLTQQILATLGPSSRAAVLAPGPAPQPPSTWQTITYGGLTLRVPPGWPTKDGATFFVSCGGALFPIPEVVLGQSQYGHDCVIGEDTPTFRPGDGIWLAKQPEPAGGGFGLSGLTTLTTTSGLSLGLIDAAEIDNSYRIDGYAATAPGTEININLGLGVDPTVARTILYSLSTATAPTTTTPAVLPPSCSLPPSLPPLSATPTFPTGFQILNAVPAALATQYPTVYGGIMAAPSHPGESMVEVNSHFVILETVHDLALEAEAKAAYPAPLTVQFQLVARTDRCLKDLMTAITDAMPSAQAAGITPVEWGPDPVHGQINVGVTACRTPDAARAEEWFAARWAAAVRVTTCEKPAVRQ